MWQIDRDGLLAFNRLGETTDAVIAAEDYFVARKIFAVEKTKFKTSDDTTPAPRTRLAVFDTKEEAAAYIRKLVAELETEENNHVDSSQQ